MSTIKYLYTGSLVESGTCAARLSGLVKAAKNVKAISYEPFFHFFHTLGYFGKKFNSFQTLYGLGPSILFYNQYLLKIAKQYMPQVLWIDKGHYIMPSTLKKIKYETGALLICYNTDDIAYSPNGWRLHLSGISNFDIYFTTNSFNISELKLLGANNVVHTQMGFNSDLFYPRKLDIVRRKKIGASTGFIGHWEPNTESLLIDLVDKGIDIRIRGQSWSKVKNKSKLESFVEPVQLSTKDYTDAIISTKINLGINSAQSRNLSSGRTFEIPACGAFLLAQRTTEHQLYFDEGREAEFFGSIDELVDKRNYYLTNEISREKIAAAGRKRCIDSSYSWQDLALNLASYIEKKL